MTSGSNTSILDDFAYALRGVVRTILGVCLLAILLIVGLALVGFAVLVGSFLWLGHKIGLIKDPPSVKFRRFQGRMASRLIQAKLGKMGFGGPSAKSPFGQAGPFGNVGEPEQTGPFGAGRPTEKAGPLGAAGPFPEAKTEPRSESKGKTTVQEVEAEEVVNAEELEEFHGSLEEFMRHKRGR